MPVHVSVPNKYRHIRYTVRLTQDWSSKGLRLISHIKHVKSEPLSARCSFVDADGCDRRHGSDGICVTDGTTGKHREDETGSFETVSLPLLTSV